MIALYGVGGVDDRSYLNSGRNGPDCPMWQADLSSQRPISVSFPSMTARFWTTGAHGGHYTRDVIGHQKSAADSMIFGRDEVIG